MGITIYPYMHIQGKQTVIYLHAVIRTFEYVTMCMYVATHVVQSLGTELQVTYM